MGAEAIRLLTKRNDDAVRLGHWAVRARRHGKSALSALKMSERPRCSPVAAISIGRTEAESKVLCERPIVMRPIPGAIAKSKGYSLVGSLVH
jgi:hypothetical protein